MKIRKFVKKYFYSLCNRTYYFLIFSFPHAKYLQRVTMLFTVSKFVGSEPYRWWTKFISSRFFVNFVWTWPFDVKTKIALYFFYSIFVFVFFFPFLFVLLFRYRVNNIEADISLIFVLLYANFFCYYNCND